MSKIYINGPFNYVKLKGDNNKILHIFFDIHYDLYEQTECDEYESVNFNKYIKKLLLNTKKKINFFLEIIPNYLNYPNYDNNNIYIRKIIEDFNFLKNNVKNNVKLFYIDIRNFFFLKKINSNIDAFINNMHYINGDSTESQLNFINDNLDFMSVISETLYRILNIYETLTKKNIQFDKVNLEHEEFVDVDKNNKFDNDFFQYNSIVQILTKLMKKYNNSHNADIMNKLIKTYFIDDIVSIINKSSEIVDDLNTYISLCKSNGTDIKICKYFDNIYSYGTTMCFDDLLDFKHNINKKILKIESAIAFVFSKLPDLYFIRKFIDKNYIEESIVYTGGNHSIMYIYILLKFFNFKIIDYYYINNNLLKNNSMQEINNTILKTNSVHHLFPYFYSNYEKQCIKINPI